MQFRGRCAWRRRILSLPGRAGALASAACILAASLPAFGAPPAEAALPRALQLDLHGVAQCPEASFFRDRVVAKRPSHADPFSAAATARLVVTLEHAAAGYVGRWEAFDATGALVRRHDLGPMPNCHDLADGLAFGFVLRFDDPSATAAPSPSPSPPPALPPPQAPPESPVKPPPPPAGRFLLGLSGLLGLAVAPAPAGGGVLSAGWRGPWWSVSAEGRAMLALNAPVDGGYHVTLHRVTGALVPCLHWRWLFGCGALELGELGGTSTADVPASDSVFIATLGARAGVELPLGKLLAFRAAVDGFGTVKPAVIRIDGKPRWETPPGGALLQAGLVALF